MKGYFITGTSTGVGKTYVTSMIARRATQFGHRVFAFKPIETGCTWNSGQLEGADQLALVEASGGWQNGLLAGVYQFEPPVAPSVAGGEIDLEKVRQVFELGASQASMTLVEGAGGWRVPINDKADMSTLARQCGLPVIVVATATLGTINHSLLTIEAVERDGIVVAGVVLSRHPQDSTASALSNREEIGKRWPGRVLVCSQQSDLDVFHVERSEAG